jgi:hypothetical protein
MVTPFLCSAADLQLIRAEHLPNGRDSLGHTSASQRGRSQRNAGVRLGLRLINDGEAWFYLIGSKRGFTEINWVADSLI